LSGFPVRLDARAKAMGIFMNSREKAELLFKRNHEKSADGQIAPIEYEQRARADREKTARLRALRLARDAKSRPDPDETAERRIRN
jgi:hypothetical protein